MKSTIVQCLTEWGYSFDANGGIILLEDGTSVEIIKPQNYLIIDIPVYTLDMPDEDMADNVRTLCEQLNDGFVWHTHFSYSEEWEEATAALEFDWTSDKDGILRLHKAMLIAYHLPTFFADALDIIDANGTITVAEIWQLEHQLMEKVYTELMADKTILYIHGLASSGQSSSAKEIQRCLPKSCILSPDLPLDPQDAYYMLCRIVDEQDVDIVVGTSMGGMFANALNGVPKILVNPAFHVSEFMRRQLGTHPFLNARADGATHFEITEALCDAYAKLEEKQFSRFPEHNPGKTFALFGTEDDVVCCRPEYEQHFGDTYAVFSGGHRLTPEVIHTTLIPTIVELSK